MIGRIIDWCVTHRFLVVVGAIASTLFGIWSWRRMPLDALPDISDVQVIVHARWPGQPPQLIEDQVTYPAVTTLLAAPAIKAVRAQTMFGDAYIYAVFQDGTDPYWARARVNEYLGQIENRLPAGVRAELGPDATGAGWIFEYVLVDRTHRHDLAELRSVQDWLLRYQLETVPGVAEIATIGGFVKQYQVNVDPDRLRAYNLALDTIIDRVRDSTGEVGARSLELGGARYAVRGVGYVRSVEDLRQVPLAVKDGTPVLVGDVGDVTVGPDIREGVAEWNGDGEIVGGIVVMRDGMNALDVIDGVKRKLTELQASLPAGVEVVTAYDRSGLIRGSVDTLRGDLLEEIAIVSVVSLIFLFHVRSALIPILILPVAVVSVFIAMQELRISSNVMSLGGIALAIGVLIDAAIVMVENGHRRLAGTPRDLRPADRLNVLQAAAKQVAPALFFSLVIIVVAFLPVFLLEAQEGRMFRPLAWTKTMAVTGASILAITLVPVLMTIFIRGRLRAESENPVSRVTQAIYLPILRWCLAHRRVTLLINVLFLVGCAPLAWSLGSQFMPPLAEHTALYMPTTLPGVSVTQASRLLQTQDRILRSFPEVESVFGSVGRSDSATDNAPLDMFDTTVTLKAPDEWRPGMTYERLIHDMDEQLQFPGVTNTWTMPVENRLDMSLTGLKTPVGLKIQGPSLEGIQSLGARVQQILSTLPELRSAFAERVNDGYYVNIDVDRVAAARYGLTVGMVQRAVATAVGGVDVGENIEGPERYPISVRYNRDFRSNLQALSAVLVSTPAGPPIQLGTVARLSLGQGPAMVRDEDGRLTGYVYLDLSTSDYGGFVDRANRLLQTSLAPSPGYTVTWAGEYQFQMRATRRIAIIVPVVLFAIFALLYLLFDSLAEATILVVPVVYALSGGLILQWWLGYPFSVAVWVGYIALFGIAIETGVVMIIYLREALDLRRSRGDLSSERDIVAATIEGAVRRLRPKLMTVAAVLGSLMPILWHSGVGSEVMRPIAAPIVGGMVTSTIHVLILVPVLFAWMQEHARRRLAPSVRADGSDDGQ